MHFQLALLVCLTSVSLPFLVSASPLLPHPPQLPPWLRHSTTAVGPVATLNASATATVSAYTATSIETTTIDVTSYYTTVTAPSNQPPLVYSGTPRIGVLPPLPPATHAASSSPSSLPAETPAPRVAAPRIGLLPQPSSCPECEAWNPAVFGVWVPEQGHKTNKTSKIFQPKAYCFRPLPSSPPLILSPLTCYQWGCIPRPASNPDEAMDAFRIQCEHNPKIEGQRRFWKVDVEVTREQITTTVLTYTNYPTATVTATATATTTATVTQTKTETITADVIVEPNTTATVPLTITA